MKSSQRIARTLLVITLFIAASIVAHAQASVVYVTANRGSDLNPCSRTSPCRSVTQGITTVAAGGTVEILDSGDYTPFTVNKSVTIEGAPGITAVIVTTSGDGITVTTAATTDRVVLRGLTVKGQAGTSSGISVTAQLASLHIENCVVTDFAGGTGGININAAGEYFITETEVRNNASRGLIFNTATGTIAGTVEHCLIENNGNIGLFVLNNSTVIVRDSVAARTVLGGGFAALGATARLSVENCLSTQNGSGGVAAVSSSTVRVSNSTLVKNGTFGLNNISGTLQSSGNNQTGGNGSGPTSGTITAASVN
jgi:hypothetical protein